MISLQQPNNKLLLLLSLRCSHKNQRPRQPRAIYRIGLVVKVIEDQLADILILMLTKTQQQQLLVKTKNNKMINKDSREAPVLTSPISTSPLSTTQLLCLPKLHMVVTMPLLKTALSYKISFAQLTHLVTR